MAECKTQRRRRTAISDNPNGGRMIFSAREAKGRTMFIAAQFSSACLVSFRTRPFKNQPKAAIALK